MIYAQIAGGLKLHLAYEPGEGLDDAHLIRAGTLSAPLCGTPRFIGQYRMTCNMPLAHACKTCQRVYQQRAALREGLCATEDRPL
jgi:hypothetical protein